MPHDQLAYIIIQRSQLRLITSIPPFMPYTDPVKWELDNVKHEDPTFSEHIGTFTAAFNPNTLSKAYALGPPKQLMSHKFLDKAISGYNY